MKRTKKTDIRHAYAAPEAACVELMTECLMQAASKFENVDTVGFGTGSEDDDWM